jgi:hypothetical protein
MGQRRRRHGTGSHSPPGAACCWAGAELNVQTTTGASPLIMACDLSNPEQDLGVAKALVNPAARLPATHGPWTVGGYALTYSS